MTKVLILCGGMGARFDSETQTKPKPLIEVDGGPILGHIMDMFESQGFDDFLIAGGYKWEMIDEYLSTRYRTRRSPEKDLVLYGDARDTKTFLIDTGEKALTGERVSRFDSELFFTQPYFLTYGDGLSNVDLNRLLEFHSNDNESPKITVTAVRPPGRFGAIECWDNSDVVMSFNEKPADGWINGGFMVVDPRFNEQYSSSMPESFESGAMVRGAQEHSMRAFKHEGYWRCMDTRRDVEQVERDIVENYGIYPWMKPYRL